MSSQLALWVLQPVLQMILAAVMFRRKLHKNFPTFFVFTIAQIAIFAIEYPLYHWFWNTKTYFDVFWLSTALNVILEFKIIHEVLVDTFQPYPALKDLGTALFKWAALVMILISVVLVSVSTNWSDPLLQTILVVHRCVRVIQCGMVLFLLAFGKHLGLSWRRQGFGIILGFGTIAGAELLTNALFSGAHISKSLMSQVNMTTCNSGLLLWLLYSCLNHSELRAPVLVPLRWDEALTDIHPGGDSESLIPMFEHMVDRAFSKAQDHRA